ncbi:hypothetical protein E2C05_24825 [Paracraurococcus ruber]|uniref:hypothetical protein n=1 Tax=Paracraurococcus ruber TaxID=77675 RepID=UPI00105789BD|nr:hypothetical protein [Paracraurococcus ruber]TDG26852.1 hypothetical protein E2C05_24825 [Paracraurococcus ruber]
MTGHGVLGIATCGSDGATDEPVPTWLLIKMPAGLLLTNALTSSPVGVYGSIVAAFTAITSIEGAEPMNDNEPSGCGELASSSMGVLPSALPYLASQIGTGFVLGRRTVQRKWTK